MPARPLVLPDRPRGLDATAGGCHRHRVTTPRAFPADRPDAVGEALHLLRPTGVLYCRSELTAPWGVAMPPMDDLLFLHVTTAGSGWWLEVDGEAPRPLQRGSVALVAARTPHRLLSEPGARATPLFDIPVERVTERYEILRHGGGGEPALALCTALRLDDVAAARLLPELPPAVVVDAWGDDELGWVDGTMRMVAREAAARRPGGEAVLTRLADVLAVQVLRAWLDTAPPTDRGWLAALRDPHVGRALAEVHRSPGLPWTLAGLASLAHLSRSSFAARFTALVGEPAMQYVARWRLQVARQRLADGAGSVAAVARAVGYQSEAAFSRAFVREFGSTPGAVRRADATLLPAGPPAFPVTVPAPVRS